MSDRLEAIVMLERLAVMEARESFWAYRQFINPKLIRGWWQREMAHELQHFYERMIACESPKLVIEAPPQHGKSKMIVDFITWVAGQNPDLKTIYTSFSNRLGVRANLMCQRIYDSEAYAKVFPDLKINKNGTTHDDAQGATRNRELIEYIGADGFFRNTTVNGSITGESLDLGVIDDPIKGREQASSKAVREKAWDWFTDDFFTRFSEGGAMLAILTRWHIEDPIGRLRKELGDEVRVVSYPAIATKKEKHREIGQPLFPELKSLQFLLDRKALMASVNWEALYQQNPQVVGGEIIKGEHFGMYTVLPIIRNRAIYADTAMKTEEHNDYSVFQCWGRGDDNKVYLIDMIRGKWEAPELERRSVAFWAKHIGGDSSRLGALRQMKVEDKASGTGLIQGLKTKHRIPVVGIQRSKDKYTRVLDVLGYIESGYVVLPQNAPYLTDFIAECESFSPYGTHKHDDQIDPMVDAITDLLVPTKQPAGILLSAKLNG